MTLLSARSRASFLLAVAVPGVPSFDLPELYRATVDRADAVLTTSEEKIQIEETKSQASGALFPNISAVGTHNRNDRPAAGTTASLAPASQTNVRLFGRQTLFRGGSEYAFLSQANQLIEAKEAELEASRQNYFLGLASAYYDTLLRQAEVNHARTEVELNDEQITELRGRVKIGRTRSSDLLTVQAARASSNARLQSAESALRASKLALANLARIAPIFELRENQIASIPLEPLESYLRSSATRPDLIAARKNRDAVAKGIAIERGDHLPLIDVSGNYYLKREGFNANSKWDASLNVTLPLFAGGVIQSQVRQAASALKTAEIQTGLLERTAQTEIRSLHQNLVAAVAELKSFEEGVALAQRAYQQIRRDYRFGLTTNLDLVNALRSLTEAKRAYDQARYQRLLERTRLEIGAGRVPLAT